jgi:hypothetical protein
VGLVGCGGEETPEIIEYDLTISSTEGGSVTTPGEGIFTYDEGEVVNLAADADEGYRFINWTGDVDDIANVGDASTTINVNDHYVIIAKFEAIPPIQYRLTVSSATGGSVTTPGPGIFTHDAGTVVNLVAEGEEGYGFAKWVGDVSGIANINAARTTITMNGDYAITASFGVAIYDWYDLDAVGDNLEGNYVLMNDLDTATAGYAQLASSTADGGRGWDPIGAYMRWDSTEGQWVGEIFKGAFYGKGHEIRDLFIRRPGDEQVGLFANVGGGLIEDLGLTDSTVTGLMHVGGLVGWNTDGGTIRDCYYSGSVSGDTSVGGLIGYNHGIVSNSYYNYDQVLINGTHIITIGALFNEDFQQWLADDKVLDVNERLTREDGDYMINDVSDFKQLLAFGQDCSLSFRLKNDLDLTSDPNFYIPYLAGDFKGDGHKISNLTFNFVFVSQVGLFGFLCAEVSDVGVENARVIGCAQVGCLAGANMRATISRCYATGIATYGDGLVGVNWGTIVDSYSMAGEVFSGLVGVNAAEATVSNSYSTGSVDISCVDCGGFISWNMGTISNSFWDIQTSGTATSDGGIGRTTTGMKNIATFSGAGWNITAVALGERNTAYTWNIVDGQTYPFLSWEPVS